MQFSKIAAVLAFAMSVSAIPVAEPAIAIRGPLLGGDDNSDNSDNSSDDDQINQCSGGLNYCKQGNRWSKGGQNCRNGEVYCCNNSNKIGVLNCANLLNDNNVELNLGSLSGFLLGKA